MKILVASTAALLLLAGATLASAAPSETVSIAVSKAKLDLNNPRDAHRMMKRIDAAALEVCGAYPQSALGVKRAIAGSPCHRDAVAGAMAQLQSSRASLDVAPSAR